MSEKEDDKKDLLIENEDKSVSLKVDDHNSKKNLKDKDIDALVEFGYDRDLVETIYKNVLPINIDEALDYLYKNKNNKFTHSYISTSSSLCAICEQAESEHAKQTIPYQDISDQASKLKSPHFNYNASEVDYTCEICDGDITYEEIRKIKITCGHKFCESCWLDYLREKITNGKVYKISCMKHKCPKVLDEAFIKSIIGSDEDLLKKYDKFLGNRKIIDSNKNIKFCPFPDCDGYAEKTSIFKKNVKCNFGHEFCFECGQKPHGWKSCSGMIDKGFEEWKHHTLVKRCPYCRFWTEKNEGCNHMTCPQCNFQWCWVCEKECVAGHYAFGTCKDLQFSDVYSKQDARNLLCQNCGLLCCFSCILMKIVFLLIYLTGMPFLYLVVLMKDTNDDDKYYYYDDHCFNCVFYACFIPFFICYEVITICYVTVLSIPAIIICPYYRFLRYIFYGKIFGKLFSV